MTIRRVGKIFVRCILFILCLFVVDTLLNGFFPDVAFTLPRHQCVKNIDAYREGEDTSCPLAVGAKGYETFPEDDLSDSGRRFVVAADRGLFHRERTSFMFPSQRFAIILLDNGERRQWVGWDEDYRLALEDAHRSKEGRLVERFFARQKPVIKLFGAK